MVDEDGVVRDKVNGLGTESVDAGAMVSIATGTSTRFGAETVEQAVTRVVRVPALHEAMLDGVLDEYKARCIADDLTDVPHDLARTVVDAIAGAVRELRPRAAPPHPRGPLRALPRAAQGAGPYGAQGCRPPAMGGRAGHRLVGRVVPVRACGGRLGGHRHPRPAVQAGGAVRHPRAGAGVCAHGPGRRQHDRRDGATPHRARRFDEWGAGRLDRTWGIERLQTDEFVSDATTSSRNAATATSFQNPSGMPVGSAGETFVGASGPTGSELSWFPLSSLATATPAPKSDARRCDPGTGALLDLRGRLGTTSYRPGVALQAFVRRRDRRCRFPGCSVAARQCDIDHVVPWPRGSTTATNLICLCRRHHRVKQRRRWRVRLRHDCTVEWTDPRDTVVLTEPVDHLGATQTRSVELTPESQVPCPPAPEDDPNRGTSVERGWVGCPELTQPSDTELRSMAEQVMAIALEHVLKAGSLDTGAGVDTDAHGIDDGGRSGRSRHRTGRTTPTPRVGGITTEEIDELARQVRQDRFATSDEAVEARDKAPRLERAADSQDKVGHDPIEHRSRRLDVRFARVDHDGVLIDPDIERVCSRASRDAL